MERPKLSKWLSQLGVILFAPEPDYTIPLADGEEIVLQGRAGRVRGISWTTWGFFVLTNRRLTWHEPGEMWRKWKWRVRQLELSDILSVDRGNLVHFLLGGRRLRLRLRDGKTEYLFEGGIEDTLGEWITTLRRLMAVAGEERGPDARG